MTVAPIKPDTEAEPERETHGINSLTAAETAMAERKAGQSITTIGNEAYPQAALLGALGWVMHRRTDSRVTYDSYMASHTLTEITRELGLTADDEDDDEEGQTEESTSPS